LPRGFFCEIRRELVFKSAVAQLVAFERLIEAMSWRDFNAAIWERASDLWSLLRSQGRAHNDADVLIAAHALEFDAILVTVNADHFRETGVRLEDWSS